MKVSIVNPVLREIIDTRLVPTADGQGMLPLHSNISEDEYPGPQNWTVG